MSSIPTVIFFYFTDSFVVVTNKFTWFHRFYNTFRYIYSKYITRSSKRSSIIPSARYFSSISSFEVLPFNSRTSPCFFAILPVLVFFGLDVRRINTLFFLFLCLLSRYFSSLSVSSTGIIDSPVPEIVR